MRSREVRAVVLTKGQSEKANIESETCTHVPGTVRRANPHWQQKWQVRTCIIEERGFLRSRDLGILFINT